MLERVRSLFCILNESYKRVEAWRLLERAKARDRLLICYAGFVMGYIRCLGYHAGRHAVLAGISLDEVMAIRVKSCCRFRTKCCFRLDLTIYHSQTNPTVI